MTLMCAWCSRCCRRATPAQAQTRFNVLTYMFIGRGMHFLVLHTLCQQSSQTFFLYLIGVLSESKRLETNGLFSWIN